jgi:ABC-2 type transport system permease protein
VTVPPAAVSPVSAVRRGPQRWWRSYVAMLSFDLVGLRVLIISVAIIQLLMSAGMAVIYGFYFGDALPPQAATFIVTGAPALALMPVGMALVPGIVLQQKLDGSYDFVWTLPVPRAAAVLSTFTVFTADALPGAAAALGVAVWRYDIDLSVSAAIVPAVALVALMATAVGYGFAQAIPNPRITNLVVNLLIFLVLLFSPIAFPIENFPEWFAAVHRVLPFFHMGVVIRAGLTSGLVTGVGVSFLILTLWTAAASLLTAWVVGRRR